MPPREAATLVAVSYYLCTYHAVTVVCTYHCDASLQSLEICDACLRIISPRRVSSLLRMYGTVIIKRYINDAKLTNSSFATAYNILATLGSNLRKDDPTRRDSFHAVHHTEYSSLPPSMHHKLLCNLLARFHLDCQGLPRPHAIYMK